MLDIPVLVDALFEEFLEAYRRGETVDVDGLIRRAREGGESLAEAIDAVVLGFPPPEPSEERVAVMRARLAGEPGLLAFRKQRKQRIDEIVRALARELQVRHGAKLRGYYQQLENGTLDPGPVSARVWDALREIYGTNVRPLVRPLAVLEGSPAAAFYRRPALGGLGVGGGDTRGWALVVSAVPEFDEIDRLFLGDV